MRLRKEVVSMRQAQGYACHAAKMHPKLGGRMINEDYHLFIFHNVLAMRVIRQAGDAQLSSINFRIDNPATLPGEFGFRLV